MIKRIADDDELNALLKRLDNGVEAQKIKALAASYGVKYDFCRFYVAGSSVLCGLNGDSILYGCDDPDELAEFFDFAGFSQIFCSLNAGNELTERLDCRREDINLMRFIGGGATCELERETPLGELYEILKTGFDIEFEPWYLDISHRIRHGVARTRRLGDSALVIQHEIGGAALLSQIATLPESRRKGNAARLISAVCAELYPSAVYILCGDKLLGFYEHVGFEKERKLTVLTPYK